MTMHKDDKWMLKNDFIYYDGGQKIEIKAGFVHDLASVPRILNIFFRKHGNHSKAAIVHDYLYENQGLVSQFKRYTRAQSDEIFYQAMLECGVNKFKAWLMWAGVRSGGYFAWKS
jgi:hypothetical protein